MMSVGLFGCCAPCSPSGGEEVFSAALGGKPWPSGLPLAVEASARGAIERADWMPHAAWAARGTGEPAQELFIDQLVSGRPLCSPPPAAASVSKAGEADRLRRLVSEFLAEADRTRTCGLYLLGNAGGVLDGNGGPASAVKTIKRKEATYQLLDQSEKLLIRVKVSDGDWKNVGEWPVCSLLGVHRAEDSAVVDRFRRDHTAIVLTAEELRKGVLLEFGGRACTSPYSCPMLILEESSERRERLVSAMQILRLYYQGGAQCHKR